MCPHFDLAISFSAFENSEFHCTERICVAVRHYGHTQQKGIWSVLEISEFLSLMNRQACLSECHEQTRCQFYPVRGLCIS